MGTAATVIVKDNMLVAEWNNLADGESGAAVDIGEYNSAVCTWSGGATSFTMTGKLDVDHANFGAIGAGIAPAEDVITAVTPIPRLIRPNCTGGTAGQTKFCLVARK